ncbi:MAG: hypothetical protein JW751_19310 [Polyangiaceae bacterium]|nr:hypothetical protein [Polyangiaceae bacterium]
MDPNDVYVGGAEGLTVFIDPTTGEALLTSDPAAASAGLEEVMSFSWEPGEYGYSAWVSSPSYWVFADNYVYDVEYSYATDTLMRAQIAVGEAHIPVIVVHSFGGEHGVRIHEIRVPSCNPTGEGPCQNASDCPAVETGDTMALSAACASCYDRIAACSAYYCPTDCPGAGGNACLNCETEHNCHGEFMACSGLDYLPPDTLTLPSW